MALTATLYSILNVYIILQLLSQLPCCNFKKVQQGQCNSWIFGEAFFIHATSLDKAAIIMQVFTDKMSNNCGVDFLSILTGDSVSLWKTNKQNNWTMVKICLATGSSEVINIHSLVFAHQQMLLHTSYVKHCIAYCSYILFMLNFEIWWR